MLMTWWRQLVRAASFQKETLAFRYPVSKLSPYWEWTMSKILKTISMVSAWNNIHKNENISMLEGNNINNIQTLSMVGGDSPREENPDITIGPVQVVRWPIIINTLWYSPGPTNFCQYSPISMFSTPISIVIRIWGIFPRVLLLGASGVGKSSLCAQFLSSEHINAYDKVGPWSWCSWWWW